MTDQRTPEIPETHGALETNLSRAGATALGFRHRFSTTSLSPYGMSFWALILAACGGGGGGPVASIATVKPEKLTREGYVYDGPVKGAVVYVDVNDDGQLNPRIDEYVGTTTSTGEFRGSISARNNGKRYIVDLTKAKDLGNDKIEGTEDDQDLSEFGTWLAPEGASVVSALTHLIATVVYNELEVKSTFPGFDPLRDNPYKQGLSPEKEAAFEIVRKALPGITRLVKENRELIQKNTLKIARNSEDLRALKDEINELKAKVAAIKQVAAQSSSQEPEESPAPTTSLPNPTPAPIPPTNDVPTGGNKVKSGVVEDAPANFTANDFTGGENPNDPGQTITHIVIASLPTNGRLQLAGTDVTANQEIAIGQIRHLTYQSSANGHGANHGNFRFKLRDSGDSSNLSAEYTMRVDVAPVNDPNDDVTAPQPAPNLAPSLTITSPEQQTVVNETIGTNVTRRIDTGIGVVARDPEGNLRPLLIQSQQNGQWLTDNRFVVDNNKLVVKAGQQFDFEHTDNPNGVITLRITATDGINTSVVKTITVQLTNVNDPTTGTISVNGLTGNSVQAGSTVTAVIRLTDPDDSSLTFVRIWQKKQDDGSWRDIDTDNNDSFTPDAAGTYHLKVTATDSTHNSDSPHFSSEFNVTAPPSQTTTTPTPPPGFTSQPGSIELMEHETGRDVEVYDAAATVGAGSTGDVRFSLNGAPDWLQIDAVSGVVTMTRPVDLDAKGEASRNVRFTVVATDSADTSRTASQPVSFTITNSDEQPTGMTVTVTNASFSESADKTGGLEVARVRFTDGDNPIPASQNNSVQITGVTGLPAHRLNRDDFGVRRGENGDLIIYLKATANTTITADTTFTVTLSPSTTGEGASFSARKTFKVTMVDVEHKPEITRIDTVNPLIEAKQYNQGEDTGVRFRVTDADGNIVTTRPPTIDNTDFRLVQTAPGLYADPRYKEWKLFIERGSNLTAGETITLTITADDQAGNDAVETFTFTVGERAPDNAQPTGVALSREAHQIDKDVDLSAVGALVRIIISDDGKGTVGLQTLPQDSIFEYHKISRVVYELHLKANLTLDQSKIGPHSVTIQATGNGVGDDPAAETFILTVRDGAQVPQPDPALPTNPSPPVVPTDDEVSTLAIRLRDPNAQQTEIRETPGGVLSPENSGLRARETGFSLDVKKTAPTWSIFLEV